MQTVKLELRMPFGLKKKKKTVFIFVNAQYTWPILNILSDLKKVHR